MALFLKYCPFFFSDYIWYSVFFSKYYTFILDALWLFSLASRYYDLFLKLLWLYSQNTGRFSSEYQMIRLYSLHYDFICIWKRFMIFMILNQRCRRCVCTSTSRVSSFLTSPLVSPATSASRSRSNTAEMISVRPSNRPYVLHCKLKPNTQSAPSRKARATEWSSQRQKVELFLPVSLITRVNITHRRSYLYRYIDRCIFRLLMVV